MKWKLLIIPILLIAMIQVVSAYEMCEGTVELNTNCTMLTHVTTGCSTYNYSILNKTTGEAVDSQDLVPIGSDIYALNITQPEGDYIVLLCDLWSREIKVRPQGENKVIIATIILLPMILGIFLLIGASTMNEEHNVLRIFMFLLSLITFFVSLHWGVVSVIRYMNFPELQDAISSVVYWFGWILVVLICYFMMYLMWTAWKDYQMEKQERIEY